MKCNIDGCNKSRTKRGLTCGPDHAQMLRDGITSVDFGANHQEISGDVWSIATLSSEINTVEDLIRIYNIDTRLWSIDRFTCSLTDKVNKNANSYQIRAFLKKKRNIEHAIRDIESLREQAKRYAPIPNVIVRKNEVAGNILELIIPDIHFGKLAWHGETGFTDYDTQIAVNYYNQAFDGLISRASGFDFDRIVVVIGNDMFHVDTRANTTTAGTRVDADSRYHKVYKIVRDLIVNKIDSLRSIAPVLVVVVPGNHDDLTSWHLGDYVQCWFRNYEDVEVMNEPNIKKTFQYGKVLIQWAHGDKGNLADYPLKLAVEHPSMFADTRFREIHVGHLHTEKVTEYSGIKVRVVPSLCASDYWHSSMGFTNNQKCAQAFIWNKEEGLIGTAMYTIKD